MMKLKLTTSGVALAMMIGTTSGLATGEQIQVRIDAQGVQLGGSLDPRQHGYEHAYRDGADRGRFDREHGVRHNLNAKIYSNASNGYESFMGNKGQYQQGYREGYKAGYDSAYRGNVEQYGQIYGRPDGTPPATDPYASRHWGATDMAFDTGYRDGVTSGQHDRSRNVREDFEHSEAYRRADHGHGGNYGDLAAYQTHYRSGYARGYQDGYGRSN